MNIYEKIYDVVNENLKNNQKSFPFEKEDYLKIVRDNPFGLDMKQFTSLHQEKKFNAFFYRFLNRLPVHGTMELYQEHCKILGFDKEDEFDFFVGAVVSHSKEFKKSHKEIRKNQEDEKMSHKYRKQKFILYFNFYYGTVRNWILENAVYRFWDSLSDDTKNRIRRFFGRGEK